jgi:hypothetical protein
MREFMTSAVVQPQSRVGSTSRRSKVHERLRDFLVNALGI